MRFGQIQKSKMANQDGHHSEMVTQFSRHVMSSPHNSEVKEDIIRHTIYPPSVILIACILLELQRWGGGGFPPPSPPPGQRMRYCFCLCDI